MADDVPCVLVTRPAGAAADTLCEALKSEGYQAYSQPLLTLRALTDIPPKQRGFLQRLDEYQHVIFVSTNAVRFGMEQVEMYWPQLPTGMRCYAVGEATARCLAGFGIEALTPDREMSSEGLLAMPALQAVDGQRVLIIKGEGGRDTLRSELTSRGSRVDELACYRRGPPEVSGEVLLRQLSDWDIDIILVSSGEGLSNLRLLLTRAETTKLTVIVPSQRVARMALEAGCREVLVADNASDAAMLRALEDWLHSTGE
ncbi:uroporphyrinogen-III synthase [Candidatus Marimicrobium litorale]|uniref:Uroporphyrinogen-III synthase n=1 Tax=Candidatus Marimicrobium litorale TaxID=2518991 RepID=A0ABT3T6G5_9GAMM|nr:uroporphyrinogen-III synthase [Candidatus Marimicrobium litorale]MCX2977874.1 uroporphyrinogen-III synthase [Candidatus Marimicrobium litorale]